MVFTPVKFRGNGCGVLKIWDPASVSSAPAVSRHFSRGQCLLGSDASDVLSRPQLQLSPVELSELHADLKIQERDEFNWKKLKAEGLDEDGEQEAKLVRSLSGASLPSARGARLPSCPWAGGAGPQALGRSRLWFPRSRVP